MENQGIETISLGDAAQRIAASTFEELVILMKNMKSLTPELRTIKLKMFLAKAKKRIAQFLAICRWSRQPEVKSLFFSCDRLQEELLQLTNQMNEIQDGLYFTHRDLFPKRVRSFNLKSATDVLTQQISDALPLAVFTRGRYPVHSVPFNSMARDLDLFIKSKLLLHDQPPNESVQIEVSEGLAKIRLPFHFEVSVTLQHLRDDAPWEVTEVHLLTASRNLSSEAEDSVDLAKLEQNLIVSLRSRSGFKEAIDGMFLLENRVEKNPTALSSDITRSEMNVVEQEIQSFASEKSAAPALSLQKIIQVCQFAASSAALRILFWQSRQFAQRKLWRNNMVVEWQLYSSHSGLAISFWKLFNKAHWMQLKVELSRPNSEESLSSKADENEASKLHAVLEVADNVVSASVEWLQTSLRSTSTTREMLNNRYQLLLNMDNFITNGGVSFEALWRSVSEYCASTKMKLLMVRILNSSTTRKLISAKLGELRLRKTSLHLSIQGVVGFEVFCNAFDGSFVVEWNGRKVSGDSGKSAAPDRFMQEINNPVSDHLLVNYLVDPSLRYEVDQTCGLLECTHKEPSLENLGEVSWFPALESLEATLNQLNQEYWVQFFNMSLLKSPCTEARSRLLANQLNEALTVNTTGLASYEIERHQSFVSASTPLQQRFLQSMSNSIQLNRPQISAQMNLGSSVESLPAIARKTGILESFEEPNVMVHLLLLLRDSLTAPNVVVVLSYCDLSAITAFSPPIVVKSAALNGFSFTASGIRDSTNEACQWARGVLAVSDLYRSISSWNERKQIGLHGFYELSRNALCHDSVDVSLFHKDFVCANGATLPELFGTFQLRFHTILRRSDNIETSTNEVAISVEKFSLIQQSPSTSQQKLEDIFAQLFSGAFGAFTFHHDRWPSEVHTMLTMVSPLLNFLWLSFLHAEETMRLNSNAQVDSSQPADGQPCGKDLSTVLQSQGHPDNMMERRRMKFLHLDASSRRFPFLLFAFQLLNAGDVRRLAKTVGLIEITLETKNISAYANPILLPANLVNPQEEQAEKQAAAVIGFNYLVREVTTPDVFIRVDGSSLHNVAAFMGMVDRIARSLDLINSMST